MGKQFGRVAICAKIFLRQWNTLVFSKETFTWLYLCLVVLRALCAWDWAGGGLGLEKASDTTTAFFSLVVFFFWRGRRLLQKCSTCNKSAKYRRGGSSISVTVEKRERGAATRSIFLISITDPDTKYLRRKGYLLLVGTMPLRFPRQFKVAVLKMAGVQLASTLSILRAVHPIDSIKVYYHAKNTSSCLNIMAETHGASILRSLTENYRHMEVGG